MFFHILRDLSNISIKNKVITLSNFSNILVGAGLCYAIENEEYYNIPIMALSATIPNFSELKLWMENIIGKEIFGVYEDKRFYQLERFIVKDDKISEINLLNHMTPDILLDPEFKQIGLYPTDYMNLRKQLLSILLLLACLFVATPTFADDSEDGDSEPDSQEDRYRLSIEDDDIDEHI